MIKVTSTQVIDAVRAVVADRPDYKYEAPANGGTGLDDSPICYYVHDAEPGCLIGHVLNALGVPLDALGTVESRSASYAARKFLEITDRPVGTRAFLDMAQSYQDRGATWGQAFKLAVPFYFENES